LLYYLADIPIILSRYWVVIVQRWTDRRFISSIFVSW